MVRLWLFSFCLFAYFESVLLLNFIVIFNLKMKRSFSWQCTEQVRRRVKLEVENAHHGELEADQLSVGEEFQ